MTQIEIKHASLRYLLEDIDKMTKMGLRPHKQEKDKQRIKSLIPLEVPDITELFKRINIVQQAEVQENITVQSQCNLHDNQRRIHLYPQAHITTMKISRVLPYLLHSDIIVNDNWGKKYKSKDFKDNLSDKSKDFKEDNLSDKSKFRYLPSNFTIGTAIGRSNCIIALNALIEHINSIKLETDPMEQIQGIGLMVYNFRNSNADANLFKGSSIILVHMIKMLCDGIQYSIPHFSEYKQLQNAVDEFMIKLNELEYKCYVQDSLNKPSI